MSEEEVTVETSDGQVLTAEFKDGQLQIVEVTPFDKNDRDSQLQELTNVSDDTQHKYMEVLDSSKGLVQLDLLNLTLVRCPDDDGSYQFVANAEASDGSDIQSDTVTCVLQTSDSEDHDNQDGYVMVESETGDGPLVFLKSSLQAANQTQKKSDPVPKAPLTPTEILERAKALQKAKALLTSSSSRGRGRGRKRKSDLPPPHELLASPNFKLYLYSCKMCPYKCNAVKEMWAHKAAEHAAGSRRGGGGRGPSVTLQCARCPFRGATHAQLMKHVQDMHVEPVVSNRVHLNTEEVAAADVLVCGACGFESASRPAFKTHIEDEHGATTC